MIKFLAIALSACIAVISHAQVLTLADTPLNTGGVALVRPNIMLLFDDSGSMNSTATPDWVLGDTFCYNGGDTVSTSVGSINSPGASFLRKCEWPDPVLMTPDINLQYYNPELEYRPAINADLTYKTSMTSANTAGWTKVPVDAFQKANAVFGYTVAANGTVNLVDNTYRSSYYCDANGGNCEQDSTYNFPEIKNTLESTLRRQVNTFGTSKPHYYRINVWEYCKDEDLTTCIKSTQPVDDYVYASRIRWCSSLAYTDCRRTYSDSTSIKYIYPNYLGGTIKASNVLTNPGAKATATLNVASMIGSSSDRITMTIAGTQVLNMTYGSATTQSSLATAIRNALNSNSSFSASYTASTSGNNVVMTAKTVGAEYNDPIDVVSTRTVVNATRYRVTIVNARQTSLPITNCVNASGITLNGEVVSNNPKICDAGNSAAFPTTNIINAGTRAGYSYTTGATNSGNNQYFEFAKTGDASTGSCAVSITTGGSTSINGSSCAMQTPGAIGGATYSLNGSTANNNAAGSFVGGVDSASSYVPAQRINIPNWIRTTIAPGNTYPKFAARFDCADSSFCTFDEEMTNFANWFSYYRTRYQSAKTATGQAFSALNDNYRVGYMALNKSSSLLGVAPFDPASLTQRNKWYNQLYNESGNNGTPLRSALSYVGRYYGGKFITGGLPDPIEYSCQKNYTILVTDGYWNGAAGVDLAGSTLTASQDSNAADPRSTRESGVFDGQNIGGTLADVAQYYYNIDLRPTGSKSKNNVPTNSKDDNSAQHMNTYTMGLGIDGLMTARKDYDTASAGDFSKITSGDTGCAWESSLTKICNWPIPAADATANIDDLWHAAVNGRGQYFSAKTPADAAAGIKKALSDVVSQVGSASASATSSPNITQSNNFIYSSTYETSFWAGEVLAQRIDYQTGNLIDTVEWRASEKLNDQADALETNPDARTLLTFDTAASGTDKTKPFKYDNLTATERNWFSGHCTSSQFGQCAENLIEANRRPLADDSKNVVNFVRGQNDADVFNIAGSTFGYFQLFRDVRTNRLGDTVNAVPHFVGAPTFKFDYEVPTGHESYGAFINRVYPTCADTDTVCLDNPPTRRPGILYMAANDNMLHAFDADTGVERFAYIPRTTMPEMWRLADQNYATRHRYFVDGSPTTMDVTTSSNQWKTVLVGGYRSGGSGYYALDVTDPTAPKALWEVCSNAALCTNVVPNMGLSFGNPVMTRMPSGTALAGQWVVLLTSGYNNIPSTTPLTQSTAVSSGSGDGKGYMYVLDALTGALLKTYATNEGTVASPSNLGKLSAFSPNFYYDGTSTIAYSGDLKGNIWRFDLAAEPSASGAVRKLAMLTDAAGKTQPISTKIEIGTLPTRKTDPILFVTTGQYVSVSDLSDNSTQSLYAIMDPPAESRTYGNARTYVAKPLVQQSIVDAAAATRKVTENAVDWNTKGGWYMDFPDLGERVSLDPVLVLGTLTVSTNVVSSTTADACEVGGYSWLYQLDYTKGSKILTAPNDAAAYKVPGALVVGTVVVRLPSGVLKIITTTAAGTKIPYGLNTGGSSTLGTRLSWREIPQ